MWFVVGVNVGVSAVLLISNIMQRVKINNLQDDLNNLLRVPPLGEEFIGYAVRRRCEDKKTRKGVVTSYTPPEDGEHGFDWWIEYEDGVCETMNLEELLTYIE